MMLIFPCEQSVAISSSNLGLLYKKGIGVAQNDDRMSEYFRSAADKGHVDAIAELAVMDKDPAEGDTSFSDRVIKYCREGLSMLTAPVLFSCAPETNTVQELELKSLL